MELVHHSIKDISCDDDSAPADSACKLYISKLAESLKALGVDSDVSSELHKKRLEDAGFVDIRVTIRKVGYRCIALMK